MATMNLRNVPEDVRQQFKALCALRRTSMTEAIVAFMREDLAKAAAVVDEADAITKAMSAGLSSVDWGSSEDK